MCSHCTWLGAGCHDQCLQASSGLRLGSDCAAPSCLQKQGMEKKLWAAALGCLCQLCMRQGVFMQQHVKALSPGAAMGLLNACTRHHW